MAFQQRARARTGDNEATEGDCHSGETAKQFQWDSRDNTCSHHGASHAAGGRHLAGIIRPAEQGECLQAESGSRVLGSGGAN